MISLHQHGLDIGRLSPLRFAVDTDRLLRQRLVNQQLVAPVYREPQDVVAHLGAMQAQEYAMAKWAIGLRLPPITDAAVEAAFNDGRILRTHVLRPTWHFVAPADIRWILALTGPRVRQAMAYMDRQLSVDRSLLRRSHAVFIKALRDGNALTRSELQAALAQAKIIADGPRLAHLVMHAELDALVCSGPRRDRKFTYMLLDERVPATTPLANEAALAELARRYFASRGPATVHDFSWWSGLTIKDARAGASLLGSKFTTETIAGHEYVFSNPVISSPGAKIAFTCLLPDYDEYGIAYDDRRALFNARPSNARALTADDMTYNRMIVVKGRIAGSWKRIDEKRAAVIDASLFAPLTRTEQRALAKACERYSAFIGKPVRLAG